MGQALWVLGLVAASSLAVGLLARRAAADRSSLDAFVVVRNATGRWLTAASVAASALGGWILFSPVEAGAAFGGLPAVLGYALGAAAPLWLLAAVAPRIRRLMPRGSSVTGYVHARFGRTFHAYVLVVTASYLTVLLAAELTGLAGVTALVAGVPRPVTALVAGVAVLVYTGYGGLVASIASDALQTLLVLPLLAVVAATTLVALGGPLGAFDGIAAADPALVDPANPSGVVFGAYVVLAVLGAGVLNQGNWQRLWAADAEASARWGFAAAGVLVVPVVAVAGLFGLVARGLGVAGDAPSVALFSVVDAVAPGWLTVAVVALAAALVLSSADTAINALASLVTADLARLRPETGAASLVRLARVGSGIVGVVAVAVATQGYSVLALFLLADLFAVATFVPVLVGLFDPTLSGRDAGVASTAGLVVGLAFFPVVRPLLPGGAALPAASFLGAFWGAGLVAAGLTLLVPRVRLAAGWGAGRFDLGSLDARASALEAVADGGRTRDGKEAGRSPPATQRPGTEGGDP